MGERDEAYVPAEQHPQEKDARIPGEDGDEGGQERTEATAGEGAQAIDGERRALTGGACERGSLRLPKRRVLRGHGAFTEVFSRGIRFRQGAIEAWYLRDEGELRVGFAVSGKIQGKVVKNRARRRLREAFRVKQWEFPKRGRLVLLAMPALVEERWEALVADMQALAEGLREGQAE